MNKSRQSKLDAIKRLLDPDSGATDGERQAAEAALERILKSQHGESEGKKRLDDFYVHIRADYLRMDEALARAFSGADFVRKKRAGVDMSGEWTGRTIEEAMLRMVSDYVRRKVDSIAMQTFLYGGPSNPYNPNRQTRTETVRATGRQSWDKHSKKEGLKGF